MDAPAELAQLARHLRTIRQNLAWAFGYDVAAIPLAACISGGHEVWWVVEAGSPADALGQLPYCVAVRSTATPITEVQIP